MPNTQSINISIWILFKSENKSIQNYIQINYEFMKICYESASRYNIFYLSFFHSYLFFKTKVSLSLFV